MLWTIIIILAVIAIAIGIAAISTYNRLVGKRNKVGNSWSQIDVQLKRRFDLIPNLVETVKGYAAHEKGTLEAVVSARNSYMNASSHQDVMKANSQLSKSLSRLMVLSESYPELKANANFQELQKELTKTEDKITFARQFYNDVVMDYNNSIQMFPSNIFANAYNFTEEPFFTIDESETAAPQVKF
ncbi:MAG: LemA family protein [Clostridiaceae bacterium]|jgi:LemA protein|nr:LemA family protein [Clostridiaceae bacterium]